MSRSQSDQKLIDLLEKHLSNLEELESFSIPDDGSRVPDHDLEEDCGVIPIAKECTIIKTAIRRLKELT